MKRVVYLMLFLNFSHFLNAQTGADCSTAIPLTLDGVCRTFTTSSSTGSSLACGYSGNAPVTYFSIQTNSVPDKILLNITGPGGQPVEVIVYPNSCSFTYSANTMCFDDGEGLWSFSHAFVPFPNTTFKLRVRTGTSGTITICAQIYNPLNDNCTGAFPINSTILKDNNANATAGPGVNPAQLCASTLENTAWYNFTVATTGSSIINLNNIKCDNDYGSNSNGFQIGFFTGTCASLVPITCYAGSGSFITASTGTLNAGDNVYVAIDGTAGSNCSYEINAINAFILDLSINNFSGWKLDHTNLLKWSVLDEKENTIYEIQRSENRSDFKTIGQTSSYLNSSPGSEYKFEDKSPPLMAYYRLKIKEPGNKESFSKIISIKRDKSPFDRVELTNPVSGLLAVRLYSQVNGDYFLTIVNSIGQVVLTDKININSPVSSYTRQVSSLAAGMYHLIINNSESRYVKDFFKN